MQNKIKQWSLHIYQKYNLYFQTIKYLKKKQIIFRVIKLLKQKYNIYQFSKEKKLYKTNPITNILKKTQKTTQKNTDNTFTFLNTTIDTKSNWFPKSASQLWIYNLHYFDYLFEIKPYKKKIEIIEDWIIQVPYKTKNAWHPYTISLRICNWIWTLSLHKETIPNNILQSIYQQTHYLSQHLEFDVLGNHLIANCKALIISGLFFQENLFLSKGLKILKKELNEQILDDGGHYERSPMYHIIVLSDLISIYDGLNQSNKEQNWLLAIIKKMSFWLSQVSQDNFYPLFNDSSFDITYSPKTIINYVKKTYGFNFKPQLSGILKQSGIFYYKSNTISVWFDCGNLGPDFLLAHAHNDSLNVELHMNNEPILTDSGTYDYESGQPLKWRPYFRSSKAHNVITINDTQPNEVWGSFRVGKRGKTHISHHSKTNCNAYHTSYKKLNMLINRHITVDPNKNSLTLIDTVETHKTKPFEFELNLHFHPSITLLCLEKK